MATKEKKRFWSEAFPDEYKAYRAALDAIPPVTAPAAPCTCFWAGAPPVPQPPATGDWEQCWRNSLTPPGWDFQAVE